ncbi:efflux RND transporter periplasmic adaptor subunit [Polaromonas sp. UC242_47]|uniref:efflux RND transporter periplasmic adaptor subunit n=1 Tax=Polaromonas sp. UC242_47 TaxID=3374626 RepID=UPI00378DCF7D
MHAFKLHPIAIVLIAFLVVIAGAAAIFSSRNESQAAPAVAPAKPALTVTSTRPEQTRLPIRLSANGNVMAWQEAIIGSESNGLRLTQVLVNVGDTVQAGQLLARFSSDSVQADVAQARASLVEAQATAQDSAANAARARTLQNSGALSTQQINQYNTAEQTAQARVAAAQAVLDAQQVRGSHTQVLAPDNGIISARSATVGAVVGAGTELFRLIRGGRLEWRAEVTSSELGRISTGTTATVVAASGAELQGRVRMIAPTVDPQTRTALVYVDLPSSLGKNMPAKAGMFARGEFDLGSSRALTVPQPAVVVRDGFNYVFQLSPDQRVSQLKVQTGRLAGDRVEITSGLPTDARIVVKGAGFLNDGDLVRVVEDIEPKQAPAPASPALPASN